MIKSATIANIYLFTFSSVYKILQFLEFYNYLTVPMPMPVHIAPPLSVPTLTKELSHATQTPSLGALNLSRSSSTVSKEENKSQLIPDIYSNPVQLLDTFGFPLRRLRVLVLTFNMNRKQQMFEMNKLFADPDAYDMIIIGGQEAKMSQKTSIIIEFANYLGSFNFMTINSVVMWEMFLVGFVRVPHVPYLKNV